MTLPPAPTRGTRTGLAAVPGLDEPAAPLAVAGLGLAASTFVTALSRAARSFTLYNPGNAVVRQFLADYQAKAAEATAGGPLVVDVLPFELLREGEVIYRELDRERSLAFRLFRDGIRRLTFLPGIPWAELLAFLEIMAIRFVGVRQQEEDIVTLIRKAEFGCIRFSAVEGFAPEEDNPEPEAKRRQRGQGTRAPAGFDTPFPLLPPPGPVAFRPVPDAVLVPMRFEEGPEALAQNALRLAGLLLEEVGRAHLEPREVQQFLGELRDFIIADGALAALAALADLVARQPPGELRDGLLRTLGDRRVLAAVLEAVRPGSAELPPEAERLVPLVPAEAALELLATEEDPGRRQLLVRIVESRLPAEVDAVVSRLSSIESGAARSLIQAIVVRAPHRAAVAAVALLEHPDEQLQVQALRALEAAEGQVPVSRLVQLLQSPREAIRVAVVQVLGRRGESSAFRPVAELLTGRKEFSQAEAVALGRTLAQLNPLQSGVLFSEWLKPKKGLFKVMVSRQEELLRWAAVAGLGAHPSPDAVAQIDAVAKWADDALRRHCFAVQARRRAEGARRG